MNYFKITGLDNGEPIKPYGVRSHLVYPIIQMPKSPNSVRYYEPIPKDEYLRLINNDELRKEKENER